MTATVFPKDDCNSISHPTCSYAIWPQHILSRGGIYFSTPLNLDGPGDCSNRTCRSDTVPVPSTALYWPGSFCILPLRSRSPCKNSNHHETTLLWSPSYAGETLQDEMPRGRKERLRSTEAPDVDEEAILEVDISPAMRWITQLSPSKIPDPQNHELNKMVVLRP